MNRTIIIIALLSTILLFGGTFTGEVTDFTSTSSLNTVIDAEIDAYSYNSTEIYTKTEIAAYSNTTTETALINTALLYHSFGPSQKVDPTSGAVNVGYALSDGTAIIAYDTWEVQDNGVRVTVNASTEVYALGDVTDLYNTSEAYLLLSYDSGLVLTLGTSTEIGVASAEVMAVPSGDSPFLLIYLQNNTCEAFTWGTTNWNAVGVTTTVYPISWPNSGPSAY